MIPTYSNTILYDLLNNKLHYTLFYFTVDNQRMPDSSQLSRNLLHDFNQEGSSLDYPQQDSSARKQNQQFAPVHQYGVSRPKEKQQYATSHHGYVDEQTNQNQSLPQPLHQNLPQCGSNQPPMFDQFQQPHTNIPRSNHNLNNLPSSTGFSHPYVATTGAHQQAQQPRSLGQQKWKQQHQQLLHQQQQHQHQQQKQRLKEQHQHQPQQQRYQNSNRDNQREVMPLGPPLKEQQLPAMDSHPPSLPQVQPPQASELQQYLASLSPEQLHALFQSADATKGQEHQKTAPVAVKQPTTEVTPQEQSHADLIQQQINVSKESKLQKDDVKALFRQISSQAKALEKPLQKLLKKKSSNTKMPKFQTPENVPNENSQTLFTKPDSLDTPVPCEHHREEMQDQQCWEKNQQHDNVWSPITTCKPHILFHYYYLFELWQNKMYTRVQFSIACKIHLVVLNYTIVCQCSKFFSGLPLTQATLSSEFKN